MTTESNGMASAGNAHSRFDEGGVASAKPRRRSMLCNKTISRIAKTLAVCASFITVPCFGGTVAVYEFKERPVGQSAVGVPIVNSVGVTHVGTATATATGSLLYSADAPGKKSPLRSILPQL